MRCASRLTKQSAHRKCSRVVRTHHIITGFEIDSAAIEEAIRLSEEKYCSVGAMVRQTASPHTTYEIVEENTARARPTAA